MAPDLNANSFVFCASRHAQLLVDRVSREKQKKISDYYDYVKHVYIPIKSNHTQRYGLAEKQLRKRLERQGWQVWRGGLINVVRGYDAYPNVRRRYEKLCKLIQKHYPNMLDYLQYICTVHHGMPDFICYRNGKFKFVECKLGYESLSKRQIVCIGKLQRLGFTVEVHKFVDAPTKTRIAEVELQSKNKIVLEKQASLIG